MGWEGVGKGDRYKDGRDPSAYSPRYHAAEVDAAIVAHDTAPLDC